MIFSFFLNALLMGFAISLLTGSLGCFVVWRRLAYFGDALSHSTLLGLAIALAVGFHQDITIVVGCFLFSLLLLLLEQQGHLKSDSYLGILAHSALALGIIALSLLNTNKADLHSYLFGDLLLVTNADIVKVFCVALIVNIGLFFLWSPLLRLTLHLELAQAEGVPKLVVRLFFFLTIALGIGISMRIVGALLINAMLILPPSSASLISKSPKQMAVFSTIIEFVSIIIGLSLSYFWDTPTSSSIVVTMAGIFAIIAFVKAVLHYFR